MIALAFDLYALEPLLITRLEGDPNSSVSFPYVPGSAIRGALAARYLPRPDFDLAGDLDARRLFFGGSTRYLNAYPLAPHPADPKLRLRTLPAPASWLCDKATGCEPGSTIYDLAARAAAPPGKPKSLEERFCWLDGTSVWVVNPQWQISVHTARERKKGRATEEEGAVFRYQAIAAGQRLGGVILLDDGGDLPTIQGLLAGGDLWLGGSRSGGYGRARVENARVVDPWVEAVPLPAAVPVPDSHLFVTLLSDAVVRDGHGAPADRLYPELLPGSLAGGLELVKSFKRVAPIGGFNRRWGLPVCQAHAIQAGSVFEFKVAGAVDLADLHLLQEQGVGERRAEGFGRVALNWHGRVGQLAVTGVSPEPGALPEPEEEPPGEPIVLTGTSAALAGRMVDRMVRKQLDLLLAQCVQSDDCRIFRPPTRAQLSRLRAIALNALPSRNVNRLSTFLSDERLKSHAREQYLAARIGQDSWRLLEWLRKRLAEPEGIWKLIKADTLPMPFIGDAAARLDAGLAQEYTLRLVDGVLKRAEKEQGYE